MADVPSSSRLLRQASWLSFWVGVAMLLVKLLAWWRTQSTAVMGDVAESLVHIVAVGFVVYSLRLSQKPPDQTHPYGHAKISFFSSGVEGVLILLTGIFLVFSAAGQWIAGTAPQHLPEGIALMGLALVVNGGLGGYLLKLGKRSESIIIEANGRHLLSDALTSLGVLVGLALVGLTGWMGFDPLCALLVALNLFRIGGRLLRNSVHGLMDRADPEVQASLKVRLDAAAARYGVSWHQMRHRHLGEGCWVDLHLVFADETTVRDAHDIASAIEIEIREELGEATLVTTHLEPAEDHERIHGHRPGEEPQFAPESRHLPD